MMPEAILYYNPIKGGRSEKICIYKNSDPELRTAYQMVKTFPKIAASMSEAERVIGFESIYKQNPRIHELAKQSLANVEDARAERDLADELGVEIAEAEKEIAKLRRQQAHAETRYEGKTKSFTAYLAALDNPRKRVK